MKRKLKVTRDERGQRLLAFLRESCPNAPSVKALKRAIESKRCKINGRVETFSTHLLKTGDVVEIEWEDEQIKVRPIVLWEDDILIAYDKPPGVVSEPKNFRGKLIHRLDKETSGVILCAKDRPTLDQMIEQFRKKEIHKEYFALVDGVVKDDLKKIVTKLAPRHRFQGQTIYGSSPQGQEAITEWKVIKKGHKASLLLCKPVTGRTHQLRVHLKEAGHPILGDYHYARVFHAPIDAKRYLLHAYRITFVHPKTGKEVEITAPLPEDFLQALELLGMAHSSEFFDEKE